MTDFGVYVLNDNFEKVYKVPIATAGYDVNLYGGCGQAELHIDYRFDLYRQLARLYMHAPVVIEIFDTPIWSGYIERFTPTIKGDKEYLKIVCGGWGQWLQRMEPYQYKWRKGAPHNVTGRTTTYYSDVVRDLLELIILPDSKGAFTAGRIDTSPEFPTMDTGEYPASFTMTLQTAQDAIKTLAILSGNWQWGINAQREFYFYPRVDDVAYNLIVGKDVMGFQPTQDASKIVNYMLLRGGTGRSPWGEEYRVFYIDRDEDSITDWGTHFETRSQPEISDRLTAERYAQQLFDDLAEPQERVTISLRPNIYLFNPSEGRVHIYSEPNEHFYYTILRTRYDFNDNGLIAKPELGFYPASLPMEIERLKVEISKLHKEGAGEEFYFWGDNWDVAMEANLTCDLLFI